MRRAVPALLLVTALGLAGCGGDTAGRALDQEPAGYAQQVRDSFLASCLENATSTADGAVSEEQLTRTCECILGKVEQEYSAAEFAAFEQRLVGGEASEEESGRLVTWSTDCAREAAR